MYYGNLERFRPSMYKKIQIVMDYSHNNWVIGGLFRELRNYNNNFFLEPIAISNIKNKSFISSAIKIYHLGLVSNPLVFTSITPFENFIKLNPISKNFKAIFFTHFSGELTLKIIRLLNKSDLVFCMSKQERVRLIQSGVKVPVTDLLGAIDESRFLDIVSIGNKIVWVGTPVRRKNPEIFLDFVVNNSTLNFRLLGKGWMQSTFAKRISSLTNLEYIEIQGALTSQDFSGCSHYLMLSSVEGGPMPLMETLASGLIPICTDVGFVRQLLSETGYQNQILNLPIAQKSILEKLKLSYSIDHRLKVARMIKNYNFTSLGKKIWSEIDIVMSAK